MSNLGYSLEHEVEQALLRVGKQTSDLPLLSRTYRVPSSGAMRGEKGDIQTRFPWPYKQWMIECKARRYRTKGGSSIRLLIEWLRKCFLEAVSCDKIPLLIFSLKGKKKNRIWAILWESNLPEKLEIPETFVVKNIKVNKKSLLIRDSELNDVSDGMKIKIEDSTYIVVSFQWLLRWLETMMV